MQTIEEQAYQMPIHKLWKLVGKHSACALKHHKRCRHSPPCWMFHEAQAGFYQRVALMRQSILEGKADGSIPEGFKVTEIYVCIAEEEDGTEGVMAAGTAQGMMPMIAADVERLKSILPVAEQISKVSNHPYVVRRFLTYMDVTEEVKEKYLKKDEETG